jgi:hypothetical protein
LPTPHQFHYLRLRVEHWKTAQFRRGFIVGRKRIELDIEQVENLAGSGLNEQEICDILGISLSTLTRRKKEIVFQDAIRRGRSRSHAVVANALFEAARSGQSWAVIWYEKTRCGLTEDKALLDRIEALERKVAESDT